MKYLPRLVVVCLVVMSLSASAAVPEADFYVALDGDDNNPGTEEKPFATIYQAQIAIRQMLEKGVDKDLLVYISDGIYFLNKPITFGPEDYSSRDHSVTYAAYPGENPVFSGGERIQSWELYKDNIWKVSIKNRWFRQLFCDGKRLTRSRHPNGDHVLRVQSVSSDAREFEVEIPSFQESLKTGKVEFVLITNWAISRENIKQVDANKIMTKTPAGWVGHSGCGARAGMPCFLEHALGFVDQPGEWFLDNKNSELYLKTESSENPNQSTVIAPRLKQLVKIAGTQKEPVFNLHFSGLVFEHVKWSLPDVGYAGIQAGHHGTKVGEPVMVLPPAIEMEYAVSCSFKDCTVRHTGATGIGLGRGCQRNRIDRCLIEDIGGNGIKVGWRGNEWNDYDAGLAGDWRNPYDVPVGNEILNCTVRSCGEVCFGSVGIYDAFCVATRIAHNEVYAMPYTGVSVGFRWNKTRSSQQGCIVEYNHIYDVMKKLADGGGIYTLGYQPGTILRGNLIHQVHRSQYAHGGAPNNGIFFDQGTKSLWIEDTIIYETSGKPIRFNQCTAKEQWWENNYFGVSPHFSEFPQQAISETGPLPKD